MPQITPIGMLPNAYGASSATSGEEIYKHNENIDQQVISDMDTEGITFWWNQSFANVEIERSQHDDLIEDVPFAVGTLPFV